MNRPEEAERAKEVEETLRAICEGEVDALVVRRAMGEEVFSLQGWYDSYRAFMETMDRGAAALVADGELLYANEIFCGFWASQSRIANSRRSAWPLRLARR